MTETHPPGSDPTYLPVAFGHFIVKGCSVFQEGPFFKRLQAVSLLGQDCWRQDEKKDKTDAGSRAEVIINLNN